jgi:hypothetical protein
LLILEKSNLLLKNKFEKSNRIEELREIYQIITKIDDEIDEIVSAEIEVRLNTTLQKDISRSADRSNLKTVQLHTERSNFTEPVLPSKQNFVMVQEEELSELKKFQKEMDS